MVISFDTETYLIRPGLAAPRMVCLSYDDGSGGKVVLAREGLRLFRSWITDPGVTLTAHHAPFDLSVVVAMEPDLLPLVFQAIDEGRVRCTKIREMIISNAAGELKFEWDDELGEIKRSIFTIERLVWKHLGRKMKKPRKGKSDERCTCGNQVVRDEHPRCDSWRLHYPELESIPVERWPEEARNYAIQDAEDERGVFLAQGGDVHGEVGQLQAAWGLNLMRVWGVRTDPDAVDELRDRLEVDYTKAKKEAQKHGLIRTGVKESRDTKAIRTRIAAWYEGHGRKVPMVKPKKGAKPSGNISTDREALTGTDDMGLLAVADVVRFQKLLSTYIPVLEHGAHAPVTPDYNAIIASFRTSCARPNLQNMPR